MLTEQLQKETPKQNSFKNKLVSLCLSFALKLKATLIKPQEPPGTLVSVNSGIHKSLISPVSSQNLKTGSQNVIDIKYPGDVQDIPQSQFLRALLNSNLDRELKPESQADSIYRENSETLTMMLSRVLSNNDIFGCDNKMPDYLDSFSRAGSVLISEMAELSGLEAVNKTSFALEIINQAVKFHKKNIGLYEDSNDIQGLYKDGRWKLKPEICKDYILKVIDQSLKITKVEKLYQSKGLISTVGTEFEISKYFFCRDDKFLTPKLKAKYKTFVFLDYDWTYPFQGLLKGIGVKSLFDNENFEIVSPPFYSPVGIMHFQLAVKNLAEYMIERKLDFPNALSKENDVTLPLHLNFGVNMNKVDLNNVVGSVSKSVLEIISSAFSSEGRIESQTFVAGDKGESEIISFDSDGKLIATEKPVTTRIELRTHEYNENNLAMKVRVGQALVACFEYFHRRVSGEKLDENGIKMAVMWEELQSKLLNEIFSGLVPESTSKDDWMKLETIKKNMRSKFAHEAEKGKKTLLFKRLRKIGLKFANNFERELVFLKESE